MNDILKTYMERFRENRHTLRRYTAFVLALAMITTLFVNWQLHGVGISMTAQYQCGEEEHTHTADCYTKVLTCGYEEGELENADEVAAAAAATSQPTVEAEPAPLSLEPQIEFVPHEHTDDCYTEVQTLTCMEEEHVHGDDCFDPEDGSLICDKFEHTHDESCYTTEYELTCGLEEGELVEQVVEPTQSAELAAMAVAEPVALEPAVNTVEPIYHHHTDACYEEVLTCPLPEHHHTVACLSDTSADVETPEEWQAANAEAVMTGNWDEDLLSVAKTQLGYEQSEKNFEIDPADGVTLRYYSRYGQSYGNPYGEWDVMFLSYCLKYAGIPQSAIPQEASVLALRSSMSDMDWLLDGEDGSTANVGDIVIYNKYVTRTVAVDSSADGAADGLDDQFSMDAEGENGAELEESGASALDAAPAAEDAPAADSVITPDLPDTANPEQPAAKPVDSTGTSASGADTLIPSVDSPAAEPQTTTVTDAQPVETVGIVSEADENTLTVISGDVDGKVAEVTLSNAEVLAVVDVAAAQYADEMLTTAVTGALQAPGMLMLAGVEDETTSTTASASIKSALDGSKYVTVFKLQQEKNSQYVDVTTSVITDKMHGYLELKNIPAKEIQNKNYQVVVALPAEFDLKDVGTHKGNLTNSDYNTPDHVCGTYEFVQNEEGRWYALLTYKKEFIEQEELTNASMVNSTLGFDFKWDQEIVTTTGATKFSFNDDATVTITIKEEEESKPGEKKKYSLDKDSSKLKYEGKDAYIYYTVTLKLNEAMDAPLELKDILKNPDGYPLFKYDGDIAVTVSDGLTTPSISWTDTKITDGGKEYDGKIITLGTAGTPLNPGTYTITYHVKAKDFGTASYPDKAVRNYIKFEKDSKGTATSIKTREIEKKGELEDGQTIKWTVTINRDSVRRYLPEGTKFTDEIPAGQQFVEGSFKVKKNAESTERLKDKDVYNSETKTLTYTLDEGFNLYKITYRTKVTDSIPLTGLDVSNTGKVHGDGLDGSSDGTVHIGSNVLAKEAVGKPANDGTEATLQWKSTINAEDVSTYVYYDYSGTFWDDTNKKNYKAQEIDLSSIKVADKDGKDVTNLVKIKPWTDSGKTDDYDTDLGLFKIDFTGSTVTGPLTITYATKVKIASLPGNKAQVTNTCYINKGSHVSATHDVSKASDTIKYFYKCAGEVDWGKVQEGSHSSTLQPGQKLPWTIAINDSEVLEWINDDEWVITDTIPKGLILDENSIKISCNGFTPSTDSYKVEVTKETSGTTKLVITMQPDAFSYQSGNTKKIHKHIYITYDTTLDPDCTTIWQNNTAEFTNVAEFKRKGETKGEASFTEKVTRDVVGKSGTFDATTGLLTYQVKVNPYSSVLNNGDQMVLQDYMTIPEGLYDKVTLEGISVFDGELQADGSLEATGAPTELARTSTSDDLSEDHAKETVTTETYYSKFSSDKKQIKTWTKVPDGKALVLVFHYRVDTKNLVANKTFTFKNIAELNDHWKYEDQNTSFSSNSSGTADINFNSNRLTIVKYSGTTSTVLSGATFRLEKYDETQWVNVKDYTTSDNGNATIAGLDSDTLYRLLETAAPAGYLLPNPNNYYYFAISKESSYTPPATSGITTIDKLYKLETDQTVGSFFYYCNNTPDETYVVPGKLKVVKKWTDASGKPLTDLSKVPEVKVTLTKSAPAKGHTIKVAADGNESVYCTGIKDGAYIFIGSMNKNQALINEVKASLPGGVEISDAGEEYNSIPLYKIGPITSDFTITSKTLYYNMSYHTQYVKQEGGTISDKPVVTTVGTVTLNALNKWTHTWDDLETGDGITYSITEETVTGYKTTYTVTVDGTEKTDIPATAIPIGENTGTLVTITNTEDIPDYELPSTGGTGTLPYTAVGGTMMLSALAYSFIHRKRRREGRADD